MLMRQYPLPMVCLHHSALESLKFTRTQFSHIYRTLSPSWWEPMQSSIRIHTFIFIYTCAKHLKENISVTIDVALWISRFDGTQWDESRESFCRRCRRRPERNVRPEWKLKVMVCVCLTRPFRPMRLCRARRACKVDPFDLSNASSILPFEKKEEKKRSNSMEMWCERCTRAQRPRTSNAFISVSLVHSSAHFSHSFRYWVFLFPVAWLLSRSSIWPHRLNTAAHVRVLAPCVWNSNQRKKISKG